MATSPGPILFRLRRTDAWRLANWDFGRSVRRRFVDEPPIRVFGAIAPNVEIAFDEVPWVSSRSLRSRLLARCVGPRDAPPVALREKFRRPSATSCRPAYSTYSSVRRFYTASPNTDSEIREYMHAFVSNGREK